MATYFTRWYIEFRDNHVATPTTWRVDILDSEGNAPTEPYRLTGAAEPLITDRIDTSEDKFTYIIGKQITISYEYTGNASEPLPTLFFEAPERRFRTEVRKNGVLDGVYYIKPDYSKCPDLYSPITVSLTAVDGFSYLKGIKFNAWDNDGLLVYEKIPLYDAIMTRSLNQIFDEGTVINVLNTLVPDGADPGFHLLFDTAIHTDIFYDFVEGATSVYDVLMAFCRTFKARLITDENQIWFLRIQDLNYVPYVYDSYSDSTTVTTVTALGFVRYVGSAPSSDAIPINRRGNILMLPAVKEANFDVIYKGINLLNNFLWAEWDGTNFADWGKTSVGTILERRGVGDLVDPYRAFIHYDAASDEGIAQLTPIDETLFSPGDTVDFEIKIDFFNCEEVDIRFTLNSSATLFPFASMDGSGKWGLSADVGFQKITLSRSGKKQRATFKIKSIPLPPDFGVAAYFMQFEISDPRKLTTIDGPVAPGVEIWPVKLGVVAISSKGRHVRITNTADFSQQREEEPFTFIDTGEDGLSNTIFTGPALTPEDGGWISPKPGVNPGDIERLMAISVIDQYQRSVTSWEGALYSNAISFYHMLQLLHIPGKTWMQLTDSYNNRTCEHDILIGEVFTERPTGEPQNETYNYTEWDIEEEKD